MEATATTTKKVISDKSEKAQRLINNANTKKVMADVKKLQANDKEDDIEIIVSETKPDEKAIKIAFAKVESLKQALSEAKAELVKLTGKPAKESKGPGVIESILNILKESGKKGITKQEILDKLVVLFPDRAKEGMEKTINVQLPTRMSKERKVKIEKSEDGKFSIK